MPDNYENEKINKPKSLKDIAEELGVHPTTVSKILNGRQGFPEATRELVIKKAREHNYRPNDTALALKSSAAAACRLAVVITDFNSSFINAVLSALESFVRQNNTGPENRAVEMIVCSSRSEENTAVKERSMLRNIIKSNPSAIINIAAPVPPELYAECRDRGIPLVMIEDDAGGAAENIITIDNEKAGALAAEKLLEWGCYRPAFISGPMDYRSQKQRCDGFKRGLAKKGFPPSEAGYYHNAWYYTMYEGEGIFYDWVSRRAKIDGIFCAAGDTIAAGIYATILRDSNINDFRIIGFDGNQMGEYFRLPTFKQPVEKFAEKAFNLALEGAKNGIHGNPEYLRLSENLICDFEFDEGYCKKLARPA